MITAYVTFYSLISLAIITQLPDLIKMSFNNKTRYDCSYVAQRAKIMEL